MCGLPEPDAALVAGSMVAADLRGVSSHGVARLGTYVKRVNSGLMEPRGRVTVVSETPSTVLVDGGNGFGQVAAAFAMSLLLDKARTTGIASAGIRNMNHYGMGAYFAMMALPHDMIGIAVSNAPPAMAPVGGATAMLGTNPITIAVPTATEPPLVLDMATSLVSRGKVRLAAKEGKKIPVGWGLDSSGSPTDDPVRVLNGGSLTPIAGPKGYGLALMIDVLSGVLTGSAFGTAIKAVDDLSGKSGTGSLLTAINVSAFMDPHEFRSRLDEMAQAIRQSPRATGVDRIYLPGEIEWECEKDRRKNGIPLSGAVVDDLNALGTSNGIDFEVA